MKILSYTLVLAGLIAFTSCSEDKENTEKETPKEETSETPQSDVPSEQPEGEVKGDPWTAEQLLEPAVLAEAIQKGNNVPLIFNIGPAGAIYGSVDIGATREEANVAKLRSELEGLDKDAEVVVYCGCCPFENCPNIRPAMSLLNEMGFTNHKLLNLAENLKVDWINPGYPMAD